MLLVTLVGCTDLTSSVAPLVPALIAPTPVVGSSGIDALTFSLELADTTVVAGAELDYVVVARNDSGRPITIPDCETSQGRAGLVPINDPGGELWSSWIIECVGSRVLADGDETQFTWTAYARAADATPYEPGEYFLGHKVLHVPGRLLVPVTVVAAG